MSKGIQPIPPFADADNVILVEPRIARNKAYTTYIRTSPLAYFLGNCPAARVVYNLQSEGGIHGKLKGLVP